MNQHKERIATLERILTHVIDRRKALPKESPKRHWLGGRIHELQIQYHEISSRYFIYGNKMEVKK